jgi:predicted phosphodiesterase
LGSCDRPAAPPDERLRGTPPTDPHWPCGGAGARPLRKFNQQHPRPAADVKRPIILAFSHTRKPWIRYCGGVLVVNRGALGKSKDGDERAAFALLEAGGGGVVA